MVVTIYLVYMLNYFKQKKIKKSSKVERKLFTQSYLVRDF